MRFPVNRSLRLSLILLCGLVAACSRYHHTDLPELTGDSDGPIHQPSGQRIDGYTTTDRVYHSYRGWVRLDGPDSLRFSPVEFELEGKNHDAPPAGAERFTLPAAEVKSLDID